MNQAINKLRLFFCFFSGEDDFIIRKCNAGIQISFAAIGLCVLIILSWCFVGAFYFTEHLFHNEIADFIVGTIWALLITNLYLLLLYTISPALLPVAHKKTIIQKGKKKKVIMQETRRNKSPFHSFSFLFRTGLITFLAVLMTQPINVLIFATSYEEADKFAATIRNILHQNPYSWMITVLGCTVFLLPIYFKFRVRKISEKYFKEEFESKDTAKGLLHLRKQLGNPNDFENLSKQILSTNINLIRTSDFYFQKSLIEHRIILEEYVELKKQYASILIEKNKQSNRVCWENIMPYFKKLEKINPEKYQSLHAKLEKEMQVQENEFEKYEYWADHPFRTKHKTATRKLASETELLQRIYFKNN